MNPTTLVQGMGLAVLWQLLASVAAFVGALLVGVAMLQGRRVPPLLGAAPVWGPIFVGAGLVWASGGAIEVAVGTRLIGFLLITLPAAFVLFFSGVAGLRGPDRGWARGLVGVGAALACGLPLLVYALAWEDWAWPGVRGAIYAVAAVCVGMAWVDRADSPGVPEARATAGLAYAALIAAGEASGRAFMEFFLLAAAPRGRDLAFAEKYVAKGLAEIVDPMTPWSLATAALAALLAVGALVPVLRGAPAQVVAGPVLVALLAFVYATGLDPAACVAAVAAAR